VGIYLYIWIDFRVQIRVYNHHRFKRC